MGQVTQLGQLAQWPDGPTALAADGVGVVGVEKGPQAALALSPVDVAQELDGVDLLAAREQDGGIDHHGIDPVQTPEGNRVEDQLVALGQSPAQALAECLPAQAPGLRYP